MKTALVVGMARSGIACAKLLYAQGYNVIANDKREHIEGMKEALAATPYTDALGKDPSSLLENVELVVLSPGVSIEQPFVYKARKLGIEVIGEIELGYRYSKGDFLCITGTNGKTTCTALTGEICKRSGRRTWVLGNIGTPISQCALETREGDFVVAETAALQLEGNVRFHAKAAAVSNITEDHLDRFLKMETYIAAKCKIFENQTSLDVAVLNYDDPIVRNLACCTSAHVLFFSRKLEVPEGVFYREPDLIYRLDGLERVLCKASEIRIPGLHNLENAMLCALMGLSQGVPQKAVREALMEFPGVEHRIEFVCEKKGIRYINDSKGTNPDSTIKAIEAMQRPTVLILGGYDKHNEFDLLFSKIIDSVVHAVVLLGQTAPKLLLAAKRAGFDSVEVCESGYFEDAVNMASKLARTGENVLLSPACASWDMFRNFEERGEVFKRIVCAYKE